MEPAQELNEALNTEGISQSEFFILKHGETKEV
jgi:hypothetical protein